MLVKPMANAPPASSKLPSLPMHATEIMFFRTQSLVTKGGLDTTYRCQVLFLQLYVWSEMDGGSRVFQLIFLIQNVFFNLHLVVEGHVIGDRFQNQSC